MVNPIPIDRIPEPKNRHNGAGVHYRSDYTASLKFPSVF